jgi:hypothetical protein
LSALHRHISPSVLETLQPVLPREVHAAVSEALVEIYAEDVTLKMGTSKEWQMADAGGPFGE